MLSWDVYEKSLAPAFGFFQMIFLQGWGEPLLHPRFWDMAALAKRSGSQVGFRTNALLYDEAAIERTLDMELDFISFTLTGASAATHQHHRSGTDFDLICRRVRQLRERRSARNKSLYISLNYTLMRSNLQELPAAVELAATLGADQICVEHMDCIPILPMEKQVVFLNPQETDPDVVAEAQRIAEQRSILFSCEPMTVSPDSRTCSADPLRGTHSALPSNGIAAGGGGEFLVPWKTFGRRTRGSGASRSAVPAGNIAKRKYQAVAAGLDQIRTGTPAALPELL